MEADFSGYATKAGLKCSDGRTILAHAFRHQDNQQVPLVWQHGHTDPENVLGHVLLENRDDGVYCYGYLNGTSKAKHAAQLLEHGDIKQLSIWANQLMERGGNVLHGTIREVSLVLAGANPGAYIENVTIRHSDGEEEVLPEDGIIHSGLDLDMIRHADEEAEEEVEEVTLDELEEDDEDEVEEDELGHAAGDTIQDVYDSMTEEQQAVLHFFVGEALKNAASSTAVQQDSLNSDKDGTGSMRHNVFEKDKPVNREHALSHDDMKAVMATAMKVGSLKGALEDYALQHNIDNIELLFPDARMEDDTPEWNKRRTEWVNVVLSTVRKRPFSRVKTMFADLTYEEARARGYVKGNFKREEFFNVAKRVTEPTTIYKKQKLDRDDILDITDFDVVVWLKAEMRLMLEEELARAILLGDGRDIAHQDKINEQNIRPIATDHMLYTTTLTVNLSDPNSTFNEIIDAFISHRWELKGSGTPVMFTSETYISQALLLKDTTGRKLYNSLDELANTLRVSAIIPVEVMDEYDDLVAIIVNLNDYFVGTDRGGEVSLFEDFDIDYNQQKYLIETRCSGALAKLKSAIVIRKAASSGDSSVTPDKPTWDGEEITIVNQTGVVYKNADTDAVMNAAGSPYAVPAGEAIEVYAEPASGYYFPTTAKTAWRFRNYTEA